MRGDSFGKSDVALLAVFVAATEQNDNSSSLAHKVEAIAWPVVNAHFGYAIAYGLDIAEVAHSDVPQTGLDTGDSATVPQTFNPPRESVALDNIQNIIVLSTKLLICQICMAILREYMENPHMMDRMEFSNSVTRFSRPSWFGKYLMYLRCLRSNGTSSDVLHYHDHVTVACVGKASFIQNVRITSGEVADYQFALLYGREDIIADSRRSVDLVNAKRL